MNQTVNILFVIYFLSFKYDDIWGTTLISHKPATLCTLGAETSWRVLCCYKAARTVKTDIAKNKTMCSSFMRFSVLFSSVKCCCMTYMTKEQERKKEGQAPPHPRLETLWTPGRERNESSASTINMNRNRQVVTDNIYTALTNCKVHVMSFSQSSESVQTTTLVVVLEKLNKAYLQMKEKETTLDFTVQ